ncbi:MAG: ATP:cob(I)alamin adenosyltransferase [Bacilli bacterium]|nr:ATP:cob(I)alamin adenosyltransferase [Bacilli bacterium]
MVIDKVKQVTTKKGDKGTSKDYSSRSFRKDNILFETLGTMDELSSNLGLAYHYTKNEEIIVVQKELQKINSLIATDPQSEQYKKLAKMSLEPVEWLEMKMQDLLDKKPLEPRFTLPGSEKSLNGAYIDVSRTIARRAERRLTEFVELHQRSDLELVQSFVNRLSDYLFVLSCNI